MTTAPAFNDAALVAAVRRILDDNPETEAQALREQVATLTRQLADALQQRDAAAENARREAKRSDMLGERIAGARLALQSNMAPAYVIDFLDVAIDEHTPKPRVAVVMSPRFVTQEQFDAAAEVSRRSRWGGRKGGGFSPMKPATRSRTSCFRSASPSQTSPLRNPITTAK